MLKPVDLSDGLLDLFAFLSHTLVQFPLHCSCLFLLSSAVLHLQLVLLLLLKDFLLLELELALVALEFLLAFFPLSGFFFVEDLPLLLDLALFLGDSLLSSGLLLLDRLEKLVTVELLQL